MSEPRIIVRTKEQHIREVASAWRFQYGANPQWPDKARILEQLEALDQESITAEAVDTIIGNGSWTRLECDCCERDVAVLVQLGDPHDYESATLDVCPDCLTAALASVRGEETP